MLLQVSVQELHNIMVSPPGEGGPKEARDEENNIIISDANLRNIIPPQLKDMNSQYKVMCGCERLHICQNHAFIIIIMA